MTIPGELARVTGLSRPEAGRGNRALVAEGYATMPARGVYRLAASHAFEDSDGERDRVISGFVESVDELVVPDP